MEEYAICQEALDKAVHNFEMNEEEDALPQQEKQPIIFKEKQYTIPLTLQPSRISRLISL